MTEEKLPKIVRVDTYTNFNYTDKEFKQLDKIQAEHAEYKLFVNSNSHVEIRGNYPAIVCINPGAELTLTWDEKKVTCKRCKKVLQSL